MKSHQERLDEILKALELKLETTLNRTRERLSPLEVLATMGPSEEGRRELRVNGRHIVERFMSDGTSRVYVGGTRVAKTYWEAVGFAKGETK